MKKLPLHQNGIKELTRVLYALSDAKLAIEVVALRSDFKEWIKSKFELNPDELEFLDQMNKHLIEYAAIKSSNFLALRKPLHFTIIEFKPETTELAPFQSISI